MFFCFHDNCKNYFILQQYNSAIKAHKNGQEFDFEGLPVAPELIDSSDTPTEQSPKPAVKIEATRLTNVESSQKTPIKPESPQKTPSKPEANNLNEPMISDKGFFIIYFKRKIIIFFFFFCRGTTNFQST
jgi:hypothetical protein